MKPKIFLTGASGFIGKHLLLELLKNNFNVTCLVRKNSAKKIQNLGYTNINIIIGDFLKPQVWEQQLNGHDIFINSVGIIRETKHQKFEAIHATAPKAIFDLCIKYNFQKIIQISALGTDDLAQSKYHLSKKSADDYLKTLPITSYILKPSIVYGNGDLSFSLFESMANMPIHFMPGNGSYRLSPIYIDDLVKTTMKAINDNQKSISKQSFNLGGATTISLKDLFNLLAKKNKLQICLGEKLTNLLAQTTNLLGKGMISIDEWQMLKRENYCNTNDFLQFIGREPLTIQQGLERANFISDAYKPKRILMMQPVLKYSIAFIWLFTGLISLLFVPKETSIQLLKITGTEGNFAEFILYGTSIFEIFLGLLILNDKFIKITTLLQLILIFSFTIILSIKMPEMWLHPFGPLSKNIPLIMAIIMNWLITPEDS